MRVPARCAPNVHGILTVGIAETSTRQKARAPPSRRHQNPRSRRISSAAMYSASPCVTEGLLCAPYVTRALGGAVPGE
eukprot:31349-Pelagococcus_subviridis.AAC.12